MLTVAAAEQSVQWLSWSFPTCDPNTVAFLSRTLLPEPVLKKKQTLEFYHKIIICGEWLMMMMMMSSQIIVEPGCTAVITKFGNVHIKVGEGSGPSLAAQAKEASLKADVIQLSIFNNRFMGIAEQMGRTLQRTSISTNIKVSICLCFAAILCLCGWH